MRIILFLNNYQLDVLNSFLKARKNKKASSIMEKLNYKIEDKIFYNYHDANQFYLDLSTKEIRMLFTYFRKNTKNAYTKKALGDIRFSLHDMEMFLVFQQLKFNVWQNKVFDDPDFQHIWDKSLDDGREII